MMATRSFYICALVVGMFTSLCTRPLTAQTTFFSDLGPQGNVYQCCSGWPVSGTGAPSGTSFTQANLFTALASGSVSQIDLAVGYVSGTNSFFAAIYTDNNGLPGTQLYRIDDLSSNQNFGGCCGLVTITGIIGLTLNAGQQYFVVLGPENLTDTTFEYWNWNNQGVNGLDLYSNNLGSTWNSNGTGNPLGAFDILGSAGPPITSLSAFEEWNRTGLPADEFREFFGGVDPGSVMATYNGDYPNVTITGVNGGTLIDWTGGSTLNNTYSHFGVSFSGNVNMSNATGAWYDEGVETGAQGQITQVWDTKSMMNVDIITGTGTSTAFVQRRVPASPSGSLGLSDLFRDGTLWNSATLIDPDFLLVSPAIRALLYTYSPLGIGRWDVMMYDVVNDNQQLIETYGNAINAINGPIE